MEVTAEAKRIMVVALGKLYSSRTQRGGLRLHRSLLLTLVMKSARDIYHAAQVESVAPPDDQQQQQQQQQHSVESTTAEGLQGPASPLTGQPRTREGVVVVGQHRDAHKRNSADNKENVWPTGPAHHTRKRRGKAAAEPDFLPCKKAKLENCPQQLTVTPVLMDYVNCSSELGAPVNPIPLHRAIAAC